MSRVIRFGFQNRIGIRTIAERGYLEEVVSGNLGLRHFIANGNTTVDLGKNYDSDDSSGHE